MAFVRSIPPPPAPPAGAKKRARAPVTETGKPAKRGRGLDQDSVLGEETKRPSYVERARIPAGYVATRKRWRQDPDLARELGAVIGWHYHYNTPEGVAVTNNENPEADPEEARLAIRKRTSQRHPGNVSRDPIRSCGLLMVGGNSVVVGVSVGSKAIFVGSNGVVTKLLHVSLDTPARNLCLLYVPTLPAAPHIRKGQAGVILDKRRGPQHYPKSVAFCESVCRLVASSYDRPSVYESHAAAEYQELMRTAIGQAVNAAAQRGIRRQPTDFVKFAFGANADLRRAINRHPRLFDAIKMCLVLGLNPLVMGRPGEVTAIDILTKASHADFGFPVSPPALQMLYLEFSNVALFLNPHLAAFGAAAGWEGGDLSERLSQYGERSDRALRAVADAKPNPNPKPKRATPP